MRADMQARINWFNVYAAAILENDQEKISDRVATARKAIADRIAQLEAGECADEREPRDLEDALSKLQILVNVLYTTKSSFFPHAHPATVGKYSRPQVGGAL